MDITEILTNIIAFSIGLVGLVFILLPDRLERIEQFLNAPWGGQELASLRTGIKGEQALERVLNSNLPGPTLNWDGWARRYPRVTGLLFCLSATGLWWGL